MMDNDPNMKIMVLSADQENLTTVLKCLEKLQFKKVQTMDNGVEALKSISENPVDFLICDQNVKFIKGWVLLKEIKISEKIPNLPVILFGKGDAPEGEEVLKQYGVLKYQKFPMSVSNLDFAIHSTLSLFKTSGTVENKYSKAKTALIQKDESAVELYSELRGLTKNSTRSSLGLAHALVNNNEVEKAQDVIKEVVASGDTSPTSLMLGVKVELENKHYDEAKKIADRLLADQNNIFYYSRCVKLFMDFEQMDYAKKLCTTAIEKQFQLPDFHVNLAKCCYGEENFAETLKVLDNAQKIFGGSHDLLNMRGICLKRTGDFNEAIEAYEEALRLEPMNAKVYFNIAICYLEMSRIDDAVKQLEACLKIAPNFNRARDKLSELRSLGKIA